MAEELFVRTRMKALGLQGGMNPEKADNPFANDLTLTFQADLKTVRTPLFKAGDLYGLDPQYAVTFNLKDGVRYRELYPNIVILFDVRWDVLTWSDKTGNEYRVDPMHRTYCGFLADVRNAIRADGAQRINYQRRVEDKSGNAKVSFVFDVRRLHCLSDHVGAQREVA